MHDAQPNIDECTQISRRIDTTLILCNRKCKTKMCRKRVVLPSNSFSQFFNPKIASIVCRGVIGPNFRDVSPGQMSSENRIRMYSTSLVDQSKVNEPIFGCSPMRAKSESEQNTLTVFVIVLDYILDTVIKLKLFHYSIKVLYIAQTFL